MPQLVKGGKYIFGWTVVNPDGRIKIPDEAYEEYKFKKYDQIVIMPGSSTSGGIIIAKPEKFVHSPLKRILKNLKFSEKDQCFGFKENTIINAANKPYCWTKLDDKGHFCLSPRILEAFNISTGTRLLVGRGSHLGPAFILKGTIVEEAEKHKNIKIFK
ncbi:MAG: hypothetical protein JXB17_02590 [Bacteroidales bacterium]|nr:hypothetical protein [Bacteroidales bacterium]